MTEKRRYAERGTRRAVLYDPDWLTVRAVAERLSVSQWQVRKWMQAGQFDEIAVLSPRLTRISRASYERFVTRAHAV